MHHRTIKYKIIIIMTENMPKNTEEKYSFVSSQRTPLHKQCCTIQTFIYKFFDYFFLLLYIAAKPIMSLFAFVLNLGSQFIYIVTKLAKLGLTFIMNGIQGVQKMLRIGTFAEKIHYAVLKQNGQYLKLSNRTLEEIFTCQLYDYGIRKCMSLSQLQQDCTITEIQIWSPVGLNFIKQHFKAKKVSALTNSRDRMSRLRNKLKNIDFEFTDYSTDSKPNPQDIFLFLNRGKQHEQYKSQIDVIKVLNYIKRNLNENGFAVIGNCFSYEGEAAVFQQILEGFGFKIQMREDITPNIVHSKKVLGRIYKNRKMAWAVGKIKEFITLAFEHNNFVSNSVRNMWKILQKISGVNSSANKYNLYILEHSN